VGYKLLFRLPRRQPAASARGGLAMTTAFAADPEGRGTRARYHSEVGQPLHRKRRAPEIGSEWVAGIKGNIGRGAIKCPARETQAGII